MKLSILAFCLICSFPLATFAQDESTEQQFEFGVSLGVAHYFGDLNPRAAIDHPKPAIGVYFKKPFNNYLAMRISAHYAQLGYSDTYSKNEFQLRRNLSFNTDIFEFAIHGDFNFFKYVPGDPDHSFTPYITLGLGVFTYDPYAYLDGTKYYLRPLGTEGQNTGYMGRKPYSTMAFCIPIGGGIKYNINNQVNLSFQIAQRLTNTDYIDDVSSTYAGNDQFTPNSTAAILQDRSNITGTPALGDKAGKQRGWSKQKDQYIMAEVGLSFNISRYKCPTTR